MHPVLNMSKGLWWLPFSYIVARVLGRVSEVRRRTGLSHTQSSQSGTFSFWEEGGIFGCTFQV
jgi:hypothetical protein